MEPLAGASERQGATVAMNRPVVQKTPEVLEQRVLVLVDESVGAVRHLAGVVQDAEVTSKLQRLFRRIRLTVTTTIPLIKIYRACLKKTRRDSAISHNVILL